MWALIPDYDKLVKHFWQRKFSGSNLSCFQQKGKLLKDKAKLWNKTRFGNIFRQLSNVHTKLDNIQRNLLASPDNISLIQAQDKWLLVHERLLNFNLNHWQQKAKKNKLQVTKKRSGGKI